ncbi:hypothetical protein CFP56_004194 [Quercus suber]|uniref:Uncharacterized protein n=1 Tax=Quercus suber TaxID=58331 RepID=A0AAW0LDJ2_QUESU
MVTWREVGRVIARLSKMTKKGSEGGREIDREDDSVSRAERVPGRDRCESESDSLSLTHTHTLLAGWARSPLVKLASFKRSINRDVVLPYEMY